MCLMCACGRLCAPSAPQDHGEAVNVDWICPEHGCVYTVSSRKDLNTKVTPQGDLFPVECPV